MARRVLPVMINIIQERERSQLEHAGPKVGTDAIYTVNVVSNQLENKLRFNVHDDMSNTYLDPTNGIKNMIPEAGTESSCSERLGIGCSFLENHSAANYLRQKRKIKDPINDRIIDGDGSSADFLRNFHRSFGTSDILNAAKRAVNSDCPKQSKQSNVIQTGVGQSAPCRRIPPWNSVPPELSRRLIQSDTCLFEPGEVIFLGTGAAGPSRDRGCSSIYVHISNTMLPKSVMSFSKVKDEEIQNSGVLPSTTWLAGSRKLVGSGGLVDAGEGAWQQLLSLFGPTMGRMMIRNLLFIWVCRH